MKALFRQDPPTECRDTELDFWETSSDPPHFIEVSDFPKGSRIGDWSIWLRQHASYTPKKVATPMNMNAQGGGLPRQSLPRPSERDVDCPHSLPH